MAGDETANFPERLREVRESRGMNQSKLADEAGLQPAAISHFETGKRTPSFANLRRLADVLAVSIDYLMGRSDERPSAGPRAAALYRHAENIKDADLRVLEKMAEYMASGSKEDGADGEDEPGDETSRSDPRGGEDA